jgi:hypothetical protein
MRAFENLSSCQKSPGYRYGVHMKRSVVRLSLLVTLLLTMSVSQFGCAKNPEQANPEQAAGAEAESVDVEAKLVYYAIPW